MKKKTRKYIGIWSNLTNLWMALTPLVWRHLLIKAIYRTLTSIVMTQGDLFHTSEHIFDFFAKFHRTTLKNTFNYYKDSKLLLTNIVCTFKTRDLETFVHAWFHRSDSTCSCTNNNYRLHYIGTSRNPNQYSLERSKCTDSNHSHFLRMIDKFLMSIAISQQ